MLSEEEQKVLNFFVENNSRYCFAPIGVGHKTPAYSCVVISRNRSPYPQKEYIKNPLIWCIDSILSQKILPEELIVINDHSDPEPADFTDKMAKIIKERCQEKRIDFIYKVNKTRKNAAIARNQGAQIAKNNIIHFVDDDCVLRNTTSLGLILFQYALKTDQKCFMLNLPQNTRVSHPASIVKSSLMGKIEKNSLNLTSNLTNCYPEEYVKLPPREKYGEMKVFKPIVMDNFQGGNILVLKDRMLEIGGFPDYRSPISYGEETGLAIRGLKAGYHIYYFPYINLASVHLTYGNSSGRLQFYGYDWLKKRTDDGLSLKQMVKESIKERFYTGMRVPRELYFYVKIRNFAVLLEELKKGLGLQDWAKKSYTDFVENNESKFQDRKGSVDNNETRRKIWELAVKHAKNNTVYSEKQLDGALNRENK